MGRTRDNLGGAAHPRHPWDAGLTTWTFGVALLAAVVGCGKKGPPLAPLVHVPAAVEAIKAERVGSDVYVTLTVPSQNIDKSKPADVARVDVYAVTATAPPPTGQFLVGASRIATIPVKPIDSSQPSATTTTEATGEALQGGSVTVRDTLTPDQLVPKPPPSLPRASERSRPTEGTPTSGEVSVPRRFYMAIAFSPRARSGPSGTVADVPVTWTPPPPRAVRATSVGEDVIVSWEPSGDLLGFVVDNPLPIEEPPFEDIAVPEPTAQTSDVPRGPTRYNVYRVDASEDRAAGSDVQVRPTLEQSRPSPLNPEPLTALSFSEPAEFGRTWCYTVRAVRGAPGAEVEGDASPRECIMLIDTVPPAPPANLTAVAGEGAITLIWDANTELDLAGYLVLRGEPGSATLQPLTGTAIVEPRYTDRSVVAGQKYVYAVVAVDTRAPVPNRSGESNRVEETAK